MAFIMLLSLYLSRLVLKLLGVEDFGVYNVVGGIIVLFTFLNNALRGSTQRFLSYSLGDRKGPPIQVVFSASLSIHILFALIVIILAETVGLWYFYSVLNLPPGREVAAMVAYQTSIIITAILIVRIPYEAIIISYEQMNFFAYLSILEAVLKFLPVVCMYFITFDKLEIYSYTLLFINLLVFLAYFLYCKKKIVTACYTLKADRQTIKEMLAFTGWGSVGAFATMTRSQGLNLLLNFFFGVVINAAVGIANQIRSAVATFSSNFMVAYSPRITILTAQNDYNSLNKLVDFSSKISFILLSLMSIPLICYIDDVLYLWLGDYPVLASDITIMLLLATLIDGFSEPLRTTINATGKIKTYSIVLSIAWLSVLPISYILLRLGLSPITCFAVNVVINALMIFYRVYLLNKYIGFSYQHYMVNVQLRGWIYFGVSYLLTYLFEVHYFSYFVNLLLSVVLSVCFNILFAYFICLSKQERNYAVDLVQSFIRSRKKV